VVFNEIGAAGLPMIDAMSTRAELLALSWIGPEELLMLKSALLGVLAIGAVAGLVAFQTWRMRTGR
jgi:hypothetical protein